MRKTSKPFLILFAVLLIVMSFPLVTSEWFRGITASILSPMWEVFSPMQLQGKRGAHEFVYTDLQKNAMPDIPEPSTDAIPARIIFRSPGTWNSSLWINIGHESNEAYEIPIVGKNSPVLIGDSIIGVIDYVGKRQSRVRLVTDSGLVPSVRVARGYEQNRAVAENVSDLITYLNTHSELLEAVKNRNEFENTLNQIKHKLSEKKYTWYLAKGEIRGQSHPLWRTDGHILKGSGFNYDFEDEYGPARDLRSGEPLNQSKDFHATPLIKLHDLLVTTGMDGVFPAGLKVGVVTKIELLREGDFAYEIEAKSTVGNLDELTWVYVIAPLGYDEKDQPPIR